MRFRAWAASGSTPAACARAPSVSTKLSVKAAIVAVVTSFGSAPRGETYFMGLSFMLVSRSRIVPSCRDRKS